MTPANIHAAALLSAGGHDKESMAALRAVPALLKGVGAAGKAIGRSAPGSTLRAAGGQAAKAGWQAAKGGMIPGATRKTVAGWLPQAGKWTGAPGRFLGESGSNAAAQHALNWGGFGKASLPGKAWMGAKALGRGTKNTAALYGGWQAWGNTEREKEMQREYARGVGEATANLKASPGKTIGMLLAKPEYVSQQIAEGMKTEDGKDYFDGEGGKAFNTAYDAYRHMTPEENQKRLFDDGMKRWREAYF